MMSFSDEQQAEDNLSDFKELVRKAAALNSQLTAWQGKYTSLHASVDVTKQSELEGKRTAFINQLKTTLSI
jgi:hypothetical protein